MTQKHTNIRPCIHKRLKKRHTHIHKVDTLTLQSSDLFQAPAPVQEAPLFLKKSAATHPKQLPIPVLALDLPLVNGFERCVSEHICMVCKQAYVYVDTYMMRLLPGLVPCSGAAAGVCI